MRGIFDFLLHFAKTYPRRDAVMAYYAPIGVMLLLPAWYLLILLGYAAIYWALGVGDIFSVFRLSGSSLFTLGFDISKTPVITVLAFSEAMLGLMLVGLLIAYLPTMYAACSLREQVVNMLEVRAGSPPSALEMLLRFNRIHGLDKLGDYWKTWETWFADVEESHTTLPALVFFRSPRSQNSWVTASGAVLDAAAITLSAIDIPYEASDALSIRSGYLALRRVSAYFDIPIPQDPHYPDDPISIRRAMKLESISYSGRAGVWELEYLKDGPCEVLSTRTLCRRALREYTRGEHSTSRDISDIAAFFQYNLARGIAGLAIHAARDRGIDLVTLSGGLAYNRAIRETLADEIRKAGLTFGINADYPLGDG